MVVELAELGFRAPSLGLFNVGLTLLKSPAIGSRLGGKAAEGPFLALPGLSGIGTQFRCLIGRCLELFGRV